MNIKDEVLEEIIAGAIVGTIALVAIIVIKTATKVKDSIADFTSD